RFRQFITARITAFFSTIASKQLNNLTEMKENLLPKKNLCVDLNAFCNTLLLLLLSVCVQQVKGQQEEAVYSLRLTLPVVDLPQNASSPNQNLSQNQALLWSNSVYDLGFWGIGEMGNS